MYRSKKGGWRELQIVWWCQMHSAQFGQAEENKAREGARGLIIIHFLEALGLLYVWGQMQTSWILFSPKEAAMSLVESMLQLLALLCAPLGHHEHHTQQPPKPPHAGPIRHCILHCLSHFPQCQWWQNPEELSTNWIWDDSLCTRDLKLENLSSNTLAERLLVQIV